MLPLLLLLLLATLVVVACGGGPVENIALWADTALLAERAMLTPATATIMGPAGCHCLWLLLFVRSEAVVIGEEEATVVAAQLWLARWAATWESHPVSEAASAGSGAGS